MTRIGHLFAGVGFAAAATIATWALPALADCYEGIGCSDSDYYDVDDLVELSCENFWHVRNRIYDENGLCFRSKRGRAAFDNSDCWINSQANVKLSEIEVYNVDQIVEAEEENGCR